MPCNRSVFSGLNGVLWAWPGQPLPWGERLQHEHLRLRLQRTGSIGPTMAKRGLCSAVPVRVCRGEQQVSPVTVGWTLARRCGPQIIGWHGAFGTSDLSPCVYKRLCLSWFYKHEPSFFLSLATRLSVCPSAWGGGWLRDTLGWLWDTLDGSGTPWGGSGTPWAGSWTP